jgi:hypothetical protein
MKSFFKIIPFIILFQSCETTETTPKTSLTYTLKVGETNTFKVLDAIYTVTDAPILNSYFVKENIVAEEIKNSSERIFTVEQYKKAKENDSWKLTSVFKISQMPDKIIRFENSLPVVSLLFPVEENTSWNKNSYNTQTTKQLTYKNVGQKYGTTPITYSVYENNDSTLIDLKRNYEIYSPEKGLLYREKTALNYCQSSPDCIGKGEISYGNRLIWKRID